MKKEPKVIDEVTEETLQPEAQEAPINPVAEIIKSIRDLPQADRLVLYSRLDEIMNYDRDKASQGIDASCHLFDEAIKSLS